MGKTKVRYIQTRFQSKAFNICQGNVSVSIYLSIMWQPENSKAISTIHVHEEKVELIPN